MYYLLMENYTRTMDFLHYKLLQARTKDQEDRIVNLMLAESKRIQDSDKQEQTLQTERNA
jgi:hypothetical protein